MVPFIVERDPIFAFLLDLLLGGIVGIRCLQRLLALSVELGSGLGPGGLGSEAPCERDGKRDHESELPHPITSSLS